MFQNVNSLLPSRKNYYNRIGSDYLKTLYFENIEEFIVQVIDNLDTFADEDDYSSVGVIAKYEQTKEVVQEAVSFGFDIKNIELEEPEIDWYDKEFIITLNNNREIWCQKMWHPDNRFHKAGYIYGEDNVTYIHSDCNSKVLENYDMNNDVIVEFSIGDEEDCDIDCCDCCGNGVCEKSEDKTAQYFVDGKEVDKKTFEKSRAEIMKRFDKFDEDFTGMLQDSLLLQCAYRDRWNEILKLLW